MPRVAAGHHSPHQLSRAVAGAQDARAGPAPTGPSAWSRWGRVVGGGGGWLQSGPRAEALQASGLWTPGQAGPTVRTAGGTALVVTAPLTLRAGAYPACSPPWPAPQGKHRDGHGARGSPDGCVGCARILSVRPGRGRRRSRGRHLSPGAVTSAQVSSSPRPGLGGEGCGCVCQGRRGRGGHGAGAGCAHTCARALRTGSAHGLRARAHALRSGLLHSGLRACAH